MKGIINYYIYFIEKFVLFFNWKIQKKVKVLQENEKMWFHESMLSSWAILYYLIYASMYCMDVNDSTISDRLYICRHRIDKLLPKYCVSVRRNFDSWYLLRFLCLQYGTEERKHISWCYFYSGMDIRVVRRPDFLFVCCSFASLSQSYFY